MLMILPRPCGIITRAAAWQAKNTLFSEADIGLVELFFGDVERRRGAGPAGVVDQDVDASEGLPGRVHHPAHVVDAPTSVG